MRITVFGGAGFIGSHLCKRLLSDGHSVLVFDNMSAGKEKNLEPFLKNPDFSFQKADMLGYGAVRKAVHGADIIYNVAANADVRGGREKTDLDLRQNLQTMHNVLEAMRHEGATRLVFTSTSGVYGEPSEIPTPENYGPMLPTSMYGASKLACEGYIAAFCEAFGMHATVFRFVNIVGRGNYHGVIGDFIRKLRRNPRKLEILGDGSQQKSYLYIGDCIEGIVSIGGKDGEKVGIYNLGNADTIDVTRVAGIVCSEMKLEGVEYEYTGGKRGWIGDAPVVHLAIIKAESLGWKPSGDSAWAVRRAAADMLGDEELLDKKRGDA